MGLLMHRDSNVPLKIKYIIGVIFQKLGTIVNFIKKLFRMPGNIIVLEFHNIRKDDLNQFRQLMLKLKQNDEVISIDEFHHIMNYGDKTIGNKYIITFDDGYKSSYNIANEILNPLGIKALFFIPTGFIDAGTMTVEYIIENINRGNKSSFTSINEQSPMTWDEILELINDGHTIGAHTISHPKMSNVTDPKSLEEEIIRSGSIIEGKTGVKVNDFAYPFGDITSMSRSSARIAKNKYNYVYTGIRGKNCSKPTNKLIKRQDINTNNGLCYNLMVCYGGLDIFYIIDRYYLYQLTK